jgi:hypothetical protein
MSPEDISNVHMFSCDLEDMRESETFRIAYSVPAGSADKGETVPLFTLEQAREILEEEE